MTGSDQDGTPDRGPSDGRTGDRRILGGAPAGSWSQADFEAALPLYVGGDLEPADAARVATWIASHPESQVPLDAARVSRGVLEDHARSIRSRSVPDLWPSVRAELARTGAFAAEAPSHGAPSHEALSERSIPAVVSERRVAAGVGAGRGGRVLGGAAWFRRRSVAMAAAVLLVTSVGLMVSRGSDPGVEPSGSSVGAPGMSASPTTFTGGPSNVRLVGEPARRGVPLRRPAGGAVHLIDHAPAGALWQARTVPAVEVVPLDQAGAALAGGR